MACNLKQRTGSCGHSQCPFSTETKDGYECIDIMTAEINGSHVSFCEMGENCLVKCPYSWQKGSDTDVERAAEKWNEDIKREIAEYFADMEKELTKQ